MSIINGTRTQHLQFVLPTDPDALSILSEWMSEGVASRALEAADPTLQVFFRDESGTVGTADVGFLSLWDTDEPAEEDSIEALIPPASTITLPDGTVTTCEGFLPPEVVAKVEAYMKELMKGHDETEYGLHAQGFADSLAAFQSTFKIAQS